MTRRLDPLRRRLSWLVHPGESLGRRAANAGAWAFALNMTNRILVTIRTVVLARLLAPEDFGLMGIAMLIIGLLTQFSQTGFRGALIQRRGELGADELNIAWSIEVLRGLLLAGALLLAAPTVAIFFGTPTAADLLRVMALGVALSGFTNTGVISFDRELEFQKRFLFRSIPNVADLLLSVALAMVLRNAWALAIGWVGGRLVGLIASFWAHPHRPRLTWNGEKARQLFGFGVWLFGSNILVYLTLNLDDLVVGRLLDATSLGLYQMAFTISQLMTTEVTTVVNNVAFPAYSKLQDQPEKLRRAYLKTLQFVTWIAIPMAAGLLFVGDEAVAFLLGEQWLPLVPAFRVLLLWGLIRSLLATTGPLFQGAGRPDIATKIQLAQLVLLAILILPSTSRWGIEGAAWATVGAAVVPDGIALLLASRISTARVSEVIRSIAFPLAHSAIMLVGLSLVSRLTPLPDGPGVLLWAPPIGGILYLSLAWGSRVAFGYAREGFLGGIVGPPDARQGQRLTGPTSERTTT